MEGEECSGKRLSCLQSLPSQGYFSNIVASSNLGGLRVYVCDHDTTPPESQLIKTDPTNILIRALKLNVPEEEEEKQPESSKGKRVASEKPVGESTNSNKKRKKEKGDSAGSSYEGYTVERLKALLREKGLSVKGRKDDLIARLKRGMP